MTQTAYPFDQQSITEAQYSAFFSRLQDTGVTTATGLRVTGDSSGMNVKVAAGSAIIQGYYFDSSAIETLTIQQSESAPRIDQIIIRVDPGNNTARLAVLKGTAAASPTAPALTQTATGIYEWPLAQVAVAANAVTIAPATVTDTRDLIGLYTWRTNGSRRHVGPQAGQLSYNTGSGEFEFYTGTEWKPLRPFDLTKSTLDGRKIYVSDSAPTASTGANGDLWFEY